MTISDIQSFYIAQINEHKKLLKAFKSKHRIWTILRVVVFVTIPLLFFTFNYSGWLLLSALLLLIIFFKIVSIWANSKRKIEVELNHIHLCEQELLALNGDWSSFGDGQKYLDGAHPFSYDMDIFSKRGLFSYLNRTVTAQGEKKLADVLKYGVEEPIVSNDNITFLKDRMAWVHSFIASAKADVETVNDKKISQILKPVSTSDTWSKVMKVLVPCVAIFSIVGNAMDIISFFQMIIVLGILFGLSRAKAGEVNEWMKILDDERYRIHALQAQLSSLKKLQEDEKVSLDLYPKDLHDLVMELSSIQVLTAYRMNAVANFVINALLGWDARMKVKIKKFSTTYFDKLDALEDHLAHVEVWISGAKFAFNNPDHTYAKWTEGSFVMQHIAHPFVPFEQRVSNDFELAKDECAIILTGPNMAGKSTYLRSVGTAILMANAGFPILGKIVELPRVELYTSMRTSDDLLANSSYFHAELHRLRFIVDGIEAGKKVFFILDEILKGTNSKDKEEGSALFLQKLMHLKAQGIIATHDLSLTNLSNVHSAFKNFYFDSTITGDLLTFDYKIRAGVCKNMNASFLLKQLKLVHE